MKKGKIHKGVQDELTGIIHNVCDGRSDETIPFSRNWLDVTCQDCLNKYEVEEAKIRKDAVRHLVEAAAREMEKMEDRCPGDCSACEIEGGEECQEIIEQLWNTPLSHFGAQSFLPSS